MEYVYLIAYDIAAPKRLARVAKVMESYGVRVQKSVFEASLSPGNLKRLKFDLLQEIELEADGVRFFRLCPRCSEKINIIGFGEQTDLLQPLRIL